MSTTTTPMKVSADVMAQYNEVKAGASRAEVGKARGITGSTVGANIKRVQAAIDAGRNIEVEGEANVNLTAGPVQVDPHEVAEALTEGASIVTRNLATVEAEAEAIRAKADALRTQADARTAEAEALVTKAMPRIEVVANALGFDIPAWRVAVTEAEAKAEADTTPKAEADTTPKAEADAKAEGEEAKA